MDQHPIPQDVTGFQFKLIGSMTVKQFGYVAAGVIMAVLIYYLPKMPILLKVILIPLFGGSGFFIAFVPIDGRPVDVMTNNFIKALFSPNQYIYRKKGRSLSFLTINTAPPPPPSATKQAEPKPAQQKAAADMDKSQRLQALLYGSPGNAKTAIDKKEEEFLKAFAYTPPQAVSPAAKPTAPIHAAPAQALPPKPVITVTQPSAMATPPAATSPQHNEEDLAKKELALEEELKQAKQEEAKNVSPAISQAAHQKADDLEKQIKLIHDEKMQLEQELTRLKNQLNIQKITPSAPAAQSVAPAPTPTVPPLAQDAAHVRNVSQDASKNAGLAHVSDTPNVIVGIVKDPRGNVLPNILVEVKDPEKNPVRAFKTNPLGQFASATPLPAGTYTIELEDPKKLHTFNSIQIVADNQILLPIEIISHDAREELRKSLFN